MTVMRLGYVHMRVGDLGTARCHYATTLGLRVVAEEKGKVYLKGWDEFDHHSIVLEAGGSGLVKLGYKCESADDLDVYEDRARAFGVAVERMSKGDNLATGDGVRITLPSQQVVELYSDIEYLAPKPRSSTPRSAPAIPTEWTCPASITPPSPPPSPPTWSGSSAKSSVSGPRPG